MDIYNFPRQKLPYSQKDTDWRKRCVMWADHKSFFNYELVRSSVIHKKINYDLVNGIIHMEDMQEILNPTDVQEDYSPGKIQHYPIINTKLNVLRGEEIKRPFDYRVVVTNPEAVSLIEEHKKDAVQSSLKQLIENNSLNQQDFQDKLEKMDDYFSYSWQDGMEIQANEYLNHYVGEYNMPQTFNDGFMDVLTVGEEIYQCDIVGGEPVLRRLNPINVHVFRSGHSNKIEDADVIILEDYWSPGKIMDEYWDQLTQDDVDHLESMDSNFTQGVMNGMGQTDDRYGLINRNVAALDFMANSNEIFGNGIIGGNSLWGLPYDIAGNIRVLRVYWKSKKMIKRVKTHDPNTGEENFDFYSEDYIPNKNMDEEAETFWVNEAWEGTLIGGVNNGWMGEGNGIFINMRPRPIQYNRMNNPSRCHFGIVGTIYNVNESRPFSMVDMMKPYSYLYDVVHYKLCDAIANNWGDILELDLANIPADWKIDKWLYFARKNHIGVKDSFREGNIGAATGKLAGSLNNNSKGVISTNIGNYIQQLMNILEYIKSEMGEGVGISKQREGQVANRETVGGVERATLQSSYITEWLFSVHNDTKKRVLECFLDTAKIAAKGKPNIKFKYIASDLSERIMTIDGSEFAANDYGLIVDTNGNSNELQQKLDTLVQPALQSGKLDFSAIMKLWTTVSLSQKIRIIENNEQKNEQAQQQQAQQQAQAQQQQIQATMQQKQNELESKENIAAQDNQTKITVAQIEAGVKVNVEQMKPVQDNTDVKPMSQTDRANYLEKVRQFNKNHDLEQQRLQLDKKKQQDEIALKRKQAARQTSRQINNTGKNAV